MSVKPVYHYHFSGTWWARSYKGPGFANLISKTSHEATSLCILHSFLPATQISPPCQVQICRKDAWNTLGYPTFKIWNYTVSKPRAVKQLGDECSTCVSTCSFLRLFILQMHNLLHWIVSPAISWTSGVFNLYDTSTARQTHVMLISVLFHTA